MVAKRIPNSPALSLPESIQRAAKIYAAAGTRTFDGEMAVRYMDYRSLNGASRRTLGSVRSFGLVTGRGEELAVSDDAITILAGNHLADQSERYAALLRCMSFNRIFADLHDRFGSGSSLLNIASHLQDRYGFKKAAAQKTASNFRKSVALLNAVSETINQGGEALESKLDKILPAVVESIPAAVIEYSAPMDATPAINETPKDEIVANEQADNDQDSESPSVEKDLQSDSVALAVDDDGRLYKDVYSLGDQEVTLVWPSLRSLDDLEDLSDWLALMQRKISRKVRGGQQIRLIRKET